MVKERITIPQDDFMDRIITADNKNPLKERTEKT